MPISTRRRWRFELKDFTQVQASVFQVARAPGKNIVYLGCAAADPGRFCHAVRARAPPVGLAGARRRRGRAGSQATMALSTNRKTMDADREFEHAEDQTVDRCHDEHHHHDTELARNRRDHHQPAAKATSPGASLVDWLFAALVLAGGPVCLCALQRRHGCLRKRHPAGRRAGRRSALGWFWRPLRVLMLVVAAFSLLAHRVLPGRAWRAPSRCSGSSTSCPASRPSCG